MLVPHGGPHSAVAANFYMPFVLLAARGYSIVAVNFRGSLGFGEAGVQALPGHIGHYDVEDCIAALDAAVAGGERCGVLMYSWSLLYCYNNESKHSLASEALADHPSAAHAALFTNAFSELLKCIEPASCDAHCVVRLRGCTCTYAAPAPTPVLWMY